MEREIPNSWEPDDHLAIIVNDYLIYDAHNKVHSENNLSVQEQTSWE